MCLTSNKLQYKINKKTIQFVLTTDRSEKKISGHRLVDLLGGTMSYNSPITMLLSFFGFNSCEENIEMYIGRILEEEILKLYCELYGYDKYNRYEFTSGEGGNYGDMFGDQDFVGLIDGEVDDKLVEIKTYSNEFLKYKYRNSWDIQARMYLYLWNKNFYYKRKKGIDVVSYYVEEEEKEYYNQFYESGKEPILLPLKEDNLRVYNLEASANFDELMELGKKNKQKLIHKIDNNKYGLEVKNIKINREAIDYIKENIRDLEVEEIE